MPFQIVRNDITAMHVDVIVNAANTSLKMGGGVCGAIFKAAGSDLLQEACDTIGYCATGDAVITKGYHLPASYIIHTAGPIWKGGDFHEEKLLKSCYVNSLQLAVSHGLSSIAFPLISSGIYNYPKDKALKVALSSISEFMLESDIMVYLVVYDKSAFVLSEKLFTSVEAFIDEHYIESMPKYSRRNEKLNDVHEDTNDYTSAKESYFQVSEMSVSSLKKSKTRILDDVLANLDTTFSEHLIHLIDVKEMTDVETYKKANIDRKLFSKIKNNIHYNPSKSTAIAFAIALELNLDETKVLLSKAGYTLSRSSKFDVIIEFFITEKIYDILEINNVLFSFEQTLLGA